MDRVWQHKAFNKTYSVFHVKFIIHVLWSLLDICLKKNYVTSIYLNNANKISAKINVEKLNHADKIIDLEYKLIVVMIGVAPIVYCIALWIIMRQ